ncbi:MAG: DNA translocase FtsK 4TM domain-containing protein [Bacteroidota bacterium]|nr:DNA translocase FtsK 4TM domain-containing protein [Bacteroidota bacterium]
MAKRKRRKTAASKKRGQALVQFLRNERVHFIFGVIVAFTGIFILLAIVSFLFTGASDQSQVLNRSFWEVIRSSSPEIQNWTGAGGAYIAERLVNEGFGIASVLIPLFLVYVGLRIMKVTKFPVIKALFIGAFCLIGLSIANAFILDKIFPGTHVKWGGSHGLQIEQILNNSVGKPGIVLLLLLFGVVIAVIVRKSSMRKIQETLIHSKPSFTTKEESGPIDLNKTVRMQQAEEPGEPSTTGKPRKTGLFHRLASGLKRIAIELKEEEGTEEAGSDASGEKATVKGDSPSSASPIGDRSTVNHPPRSGRTETVSTSVGLSDDFEVIVPKDEDAALTLHPEEKPTSSGFPHDMEEYDPRKDLSSFRFPSSQLLKVYDTGDKAVDMEEQNENKDKIIHTLRNYGIEITSIKATVGPTITLYEIVPEAGVRISRIRNLEDDIALSLSALGIRIIAPMPGKGTVGIEVPNKDPQIVSMHSVITSKRFQECTYDLPVALGKTITNEVFIFDLTKMPHLLVSGATGQGKSVGLNAIITSLLFKKHPAEMKLVLIDPKMVEFNIYSAIENHYLAKLPDEEKAIITDVSKVTQTLNSLTKEMDDRYELLMRARTRSIKEYNQKFIQRRLNPNNGHKYMPYIVVVIDEFGDLIMTAGKEIEMPIARIAQKARAVGMHMVIATQRPTTNIITGTIKANFPARMAFRVTSQIDSRTILDMSGANQLIGRGDMLFSQGSNLIRIQCAFVDTPEVERISLDIGKQRGYEGAYPLPEVVTEGDSVPGAVDLNDRDVLFEEAARLIVVHQQGSTSLIQRKFSIGYNRAGRLMDQLEAAGIVGATQGSKPREVFIADEYSLEKLLDSLN